MNNSSNKKQEIIQDISLFSVSSYWAQSAYFIRGFLNAHIVGPSMYGLWSALNIIFTFVSCPTLGILDGMSREIPYCMGKKDYANINKVRANAFGFSLIGSIITSISIIIVSLFFRRSFSLAGIIGIVTVSVMIIVQNIENFYEMALSAEKGFSLISVANVLFPILSVILTLILVTKWKIYGIYAVGVFGPLAFSLFFYFTSRYTPYLKFDIKESFRLIRIGLPLLTLALVPLVLFTIDKMLILKFLGTTELGYYTLGLLICRILLYFPAVVGIVVEPRLFHKYGENGEIEDLKKYIYVPTKAMAVFLPLLISMVYFVSSFVIRHFLVQYTASIGPLFILLFGKFFLLFSPTTKGFLTALNKQGRMLYFYLIAIFLSTVLDILVLSLGLGIAAVAFVSAFIGFLLGTSVFIYVLNFYLKKVSSCLIKCAKLYFPYAYILGATLILNFMIKDAASSLLDLALTFLKIIIVTALSIPFIWYLNRQIRFSQDMVLVLKSKWRASFLGNANMANIQ
jgi:O-antigen/teichoic acid export membrane protein